MAILAAAGAGHAASTGSRPAVSPPPAAPLNLVLVTVDSWRPANLAAYGYDRVTMPAFERWAATALVVPDAFATSAWTFPGLVSIMTGLYPGRHGYDARGRAIREVATLGSVLADAGYATPVVSHLPATPGLERIGPGERWRDPTATNRGSLVDWLLQEGPTSGPFFVWDHWRGAHLPYRPADPERPPYGDTRASAGVDQVRQHVIIPAELQSFLPEEEPAVIDLYDSALRSVDRSFAALFDALEQTGLADRTLVVVTADHGEELFEHGLVGHASTTRSARLYDEILRIPLVIFAPGPALSAPDCLVSQVDLMPTVLSMLGIAAPEALDGIDLASALRGGSCGPRTIYAESILGGFQAAGSTADTFIWAVRDRHGKLIAQRQGSEADSYEFYDLRADPAEIDNLFTRGAGGHRDQLARFRQGLGGPDYWRRPLEPSPGDPREVRRPASPPRILTPAKGATLAFGVHAQQIVAAWTGSPEATYVVEYRVGEGRFLTEGTFEVRGTRFEYGPLPAEVWQNLSQFNPWTVRVWNRDFPEDKSPWHRFTLVAEG